MSRTEYRCRLAIEAHSHNTALINFLKMKKVLHFNEKDKVLSALSAYWLPLALKEDGSYSDEELADCARSAIYKLRLHINYLAATFGVENLELETTQVTALPSPSTKKTTVTSNSDSINASAKEEDLINHYDDHAFDKMFG
ncbi:hypothetical protein H6G04_18935 [Calothrix membranacea FACHB-236]|nr:hypothetical protein [Calothrix membranacea FACHB-236]